MPLPVPYYSLYTLPPYTASPHPANTHSHATLGSHRSQRANYVLALATHGLPAVCLRTQVAPNAIRTMRAFFQIGLQFHWLPLDSHLHLAHRPWPNRCTGVIAFNSARNGARAAKRRCCCDKCVSFLSALLWRESALNACVYKHRCILEQSYPPHQSQVLQVQPIYRSDPTLSLSLSPNSHHPRNNQQWPARSRRLASPLEERLRASSWRQRQLASQRLRVAE